MFKKLFFLGEFLSLLFLVSACKKTQSTLKIMDEDFKNLISNYQSYNDDLYDLYYQEYQINHNVILSLNKVNYPTFFELTSSIKSFNFGEGYFVNKNYYLEKTYIPQDLVPVTINKINRKNETMLINKNVLKMATKMFDDASKQGLNLVVFSAYRSFTKQKALYNNAKDPSFIAPAGYSEHQTGDALDIATLDTGLTSYFMETKEYLFLKQHAHEYGFIERYQSDKEALTHYPAEGWHYRYVGQEIATTIYQNHLSLEEYIYMYVELK